MKAIFSVSTPLILLLLTLLVGGCASPPPQPDAKAMAAVTALRKVAAAAKTGLPRAQLAALIADAQFAVDEARRGQATQPVKDELDKAMEAYRDAQAYHAAHPLDRDEDGLLKKYDIPRDEVALTKGEDPFVDPDKLAVRMIQEGAAHAERADALIAASSSGRP
jgi:hypothetical protein